MQVLLQIGVDGPGFGLHGQEFEIASKLGKLLVDGHGRDRRLHCLHDALGVAFALVDDHVVVAVMLFGEFGDLFLCDLLHGVDIVQLVDIQKTGNRLVFATETDLLRQLKMAEGIQDTVVINRGCRIVGLCF